MMQGLLTAWRRAWQLLRAAPALVQRSRDEYEFQPGYLRSSSAHPHPGREARPCC